MKNLFADRKRSLIIVSLMLALSLLLTSGAGAAGGGITGGEGSTPYGGGPVPGGPGHVSLRGLDFKPYPASYTNYSYAGVGIQNTGPSSAVFVATFQVPNGTTINQMVVYYIDNDATYDFYLELVAVPLFATTGSTIASFSSSAAHVGVIYGATSVITNPVVDLASSSYAFQVNMPPSTNVQLVGVRIDYGYPVSLPIIKR
jgi:hypothetical protein